MGMSYGFKCKNCDYWTWFMLGVGKGFCLEDEKFMSKVRNGDYGRELTDFLEMCPDGEIDTQLTVTVCRDCGNIENVPDLSMYIPKDGTVKNPVDPKWFYLHGYELFERYQHKCSKCHGNADVVAKWDIEPNFKLRCPKCKIVLIPDGGEHWI